MTTLSIILGLFLCVIMYIGYIFKQFCKLFLRAYITNIKINHKHQTSMLALRQQEVYGKEIRTPGSH